jgi:hypothetical protein
VKHVLFGDTPIPAERGADRQDTQAYLIANALYVLITSAKLSLDQETKFHEQLAAFVKSYESNPRFEEYVKERAQLRIDLVNSASMELLDSLKDALQEIAEDELRRR